MSANLDLTIMPAATRSSREVLTFMARAFAWPEADPLPPEKPYDRPGLLALNGEELVGAITWDDLVSVRPGEVVTFLRPAIAAEHRRRGIGTRLLTAFSALPHLPRRRHIMVNSFKNTDIVAASAFLANHGFTIFDRSLLYRRSVPVAPLLKEPWRRVEYRGGDAGADAMIVNLNTRGFRSRSDIAMLTEEMIAGAVDEPNHRWLCLYEGDVLAGFAQMHFVEGKEAFVLNIVIARAHWGGGAGEALADWILAFCAQHGCSNLEASVNDTNHASRRFVERNGMRIVESYPRFSRVDEPR